MKKVCFIQPLIANYCVPLFSELGKYWRLTVISSPVNTKLGFDSEPAICYDDFNYLEIPTITPFGQWVCLYQVGLIKFIRLNQPDAVIIFANLRYLSFWTTLFWCRLHNIPIFLHGHGLYRKRNARFLWGITYRLVFKLATAYICYTQSVAESLLKIGLPTAKIKVADNSLSNPFPVRPEEKSGDERGILYIGRLRPGCGLELLIRVVSRLQNLCDSTVVLHVIGDGYDGQRIQENALNMPWVRFHGSIYEPDQISRISRECMVGCYPGNAGLSIVHLMSLSLPPVTHDDLAAQQGPEPSYIESGENGLLFDHENPELALLDALLAVYRHPEKLKKMQAGAYETYIDITQPSLAARFIRIIGE